VPQGRTWVILKCAKVIENKGVDAISAGTDRKLSKKHRMPHSQELLLPAKNLLAPNCTSYSTIAPVIFPCITHSVHSFERSERLASRRMYVR